MTFASLLSGGGGADRGLIAAGLTPLWAVEYDPQIAACYRENIGDHVIVARVQDVDYAALPKVDLLWLSPVCKNFSAAKTNGAETDDDLATADACCRAIQTQQPQYVIVENVTEYRKSASFRRITNTLDELGYWWTVDVVNAADCGVPQTRRRLILRASRDGYVAPLPAPTPWVGWYAAIEDLIPTLPASKFAQWQIDRLPAELTESLIVAGGNQPDPRTADQPTFTTTAQTLASRTRAFIIDGQANNRGESSPIRHEADPMYTLSASMDKRPARAYLVGDQRSNGGESITMCQDEQPSYTVTTRPAAKHRAWLERGRVVSMTPRALARLQSFPDDYKLPAKPSLACIIIGNSVPPLMAERVALSLVGVGMEVAA